MRTSTLAGAAVLALVVSACARSSTPAETREQLGALLFADPDLSRPAGQACADCHAPEAAFRDPESDRTTSAGVVPGRFGARNSPTILYARYAAPLQLDPTTGEWSGGLFWDGRANSLEQQAGGPLLNPLEMNNDKAGVVDAVRHASYATDLEAVYGPGALDDVDTAFDHITAALGAYERTRALAPFSSKYDRYLAGRATLTDAEARGLAVFEDPARGGCASCHPSRPAADGTPPLFTDGRYANLGVPLYENSEFFGQAPDLNPAGFHYIDHGLMTTVGDPAQDGKFRTPTLRNVARTAPYGHNGYFANLPYLIDFLNTRDGVSPDPSVGAWAGAEVPETVDRVHVGHLGLSRAEVDALVAFLDTLTDEHPGEQL